MLGSPSLTLARPAPQTLPMPRPDPKPPDPHFLALVLQFLPPLCSSYLGWSLQYAGSSLGLPTQSLILCQASRPQFQYSLCIGPFPYRGCCPNFGPPLFPIPHASSPLLLTPPWCAFCGLSPHCCYDVPIWSPFCEHPWTPSLLSPLLGAYSLCRSVFLCCLWLLPFLAWWRWSWILLCLDFVSGSVACSALVSLNLPSVCLIIAAQRSFAKDFL
uniref:Uncharacterized protein n=1 Tax=Opuntia streptacantha TaxID=393608 RepID=A0A7C9EVT6_OPUST